MTDRAQSDTETVDQQVRLHVFHPAAETGHVPKPDEIAVVTIPRGGRSGVCTVLGLDRPPSSAPTAPCSPRCR
jgi:hypothetical protein